jgi:hypothetical protein
MSEMIERVARAIQEKLLGGCVEPNDVALALARAAIEAMREPTPEAIRAGVAASEAVDYEPTTGDPMFALECAYGLYAPELIIGYRAMLDAALTPSE